MRPVVEAAQEFTRTGEYKELHRAVEAYDPR
jgi:hypothetical protein